MSSNQKKPNSEVVTKTAFSDAMLKESIDRLTKVKEALLKEPFQVVNSCLERWIVIT